jgi:hypothetical protein
METILLAFREPGISDQGYYRWRKEHRGLALDQAQEMKGHEKRTRLHTGCRALLALS